MADFNETDLRLGLPESGSSGGQYREINFFSVDERAKSEDVEMGGEKRIVHAVCMMDQIANKPYMGDEVSGCGSDVVGWPPVNLYRRNNNTSPKARQHEEDCRNVVKHPSSSSSRIKVMMDEAPYMRKVDLKNIINGYEELCTELENLFECFMRSRIKEADPIIMRKRLQFLHGPDYVLTYEDDDGDWMLAGDMPWKSFTESVKRIRIMKRPAILHG